MTVLITGANRGIGREIARQYAEAGEDVIATTRGPAPDSLPDSIRWITLDVTDAASLDALAGALDGVDLSLLVCNAGVSFGKGSTVASGYAPEDWARTFAVNVTGVFSTVQAALPALTTNGGGRVAVIASKMGSNTASTSGGSLIYRASKAAAINLATNLAIDLRDDGIAVGAYHPGWVRTDMGGPNGDIDAATSAAGLIARFARLGPGHTGVFENYDGAPLPY
jgi:NAD(P)-dependent dehydrogenase (short-subunit alcohol dehydrogenase family)